jgi:hypothetical protein
LDRTPLLGNYTGHDRPFLSGLSLLGRIHQVPEVLFMQREHPSRSVHCYNWRKPYHAIVWYDPSRTGKIIFPSWRLLKEHTAGINRADLSLSERQRCYCEIFRWLKRNKKGLWTDLIMALENISGSKYSWLRRFDTVSDEIVSLIPEGETFILVDEETLETEIFGERKTIPFLEKDGVYWGKPSNDETAIRELERLRHLGANFIVFVKDTFWWLEYYVGLNKYLHSQFPCLLQSDRIVIFDLR